MRTFARLLPALGWMVVIFVLSARSRIPRTPGLSVEFSAVIGHLIAYGVLAALIYFATPPGLPRHTRAVVAFGGAVLYGVSDEFHQSFVPGRDASLFDIGVNVAGALAAVALILTLAPCQRGASPRGNRA